MVGLVVGVVYGVQEDLGAADFVFQVVVGTLFFTWWVAGLLLSTVRHYFRRRQASAVTEDEALSDRGQDG
ncbi:MULTISPECIES: hypothetical protein [unclassified Kribbella]|uniref:hypothetical protein n=1 Tax=unclassified Kribbella TaxID=2644121 RepID=UPI0033DFBC5E